MPIFMVLPSRQFTDSSDKCRTATVGPS